jgi:hypothetical protein
VAYTLNVDEAAGHDRGLLMALAARDHVDSDGLNEIAQSLAADGSVASFERALDEAAYDAEPELEPAPTDDEGRPMPRPVPVEVEMATITSLMEFAKAANNRPVR